MPKLPENFGVEEPVVHPYRSLVVVVAIIIVLSLLGGGLFYHYLQNSNATDLFDFGDMGTSSDLSKSQKTLSPPELEHLFVANQSDTNARGRISSDDLKRLVKANTRR